MKMNLVSYRSPMLFLFCQFFLALRDVGAELSVTELVLSFASRHYDIDSDPSSSFTIGNDFAKTDAPSSVPGSYVPVPTTLFPTNSEAPTSDMVKIVMRDLEANNTITPSPQDTITPTLSLSPSNSFGDSQAFEVSQSDEVDTLAPTLSDSPSAVSSTDEPITLSPVETTGPTESLAPTTSSPTTSRPTTANDDNSDRNRSANIASDGNTIATTATTTTTTTTTTNANPTTTTTTTTTNAASATTTTTTTTTTTGEEISDLHDIRIQVQYDDEPEGITPTTPPTSEEILDFHDIRIQVQYDDEPEEITWSLMRHPARLEVKVDGTTLVNGTTIQAYSTITYQIYRLQGGKYHFTMTDFGLDGVGNFQIIDITNGGFKTIYDCVGEFGFYDYKEFYLGEKTDFYLLEPNTGWSTTGNTTKEVLERTDTFYTLDNIDM